MGDGQQARGDGDGGGGMSKKQVSGREQKLGKDTGYSTDGVSFWVSLIHKNTFTELQGALDGVHMVLTSVTQYAVEANTRLRKQQLEWWDRVYEDLGLDREVKYSFDRLEGKLMPIADQAEVKP